MSDTTARLALPLLAAAQAQKHITHNEALTMLDALVQLSVLDRDLATPPGSPAPGARYLVAASPTGAWSGQAGKIAAWQNGAWSFFPPQAGWVLWVADEAVPIAFTGSAWVLAQQTQNLPMLGVNATADTTNRLAVKSAASLFDHTGNGHQVKINKAAAADTASLLLQTAASGRAEIGTAGDDKLHVKVSSDGSTWKEAVVIDPSTFSVGIGGVTAPTGVLHVLTTTGTSLPIHDRVDDTAVAVAMLSRKARGTPAARTAVVDGDVLQSSVSQGYDGSAYLSAAAMRGAVDGTVSSGSVPARLEFMTYGGGALTARMEIKSNGTVRPVADNAYTLGDATHRWSAIYAANGTIQTSDRRDKDVAGGLTFAGDMVDTVDPILFRWKTGGNRVVASDSETATDDSGRAIPAAAPEPIPGRRLHAGFLAQDLRAAMDAADVDFAAWGLDDREDGDSRQWTRPDQLVAVLWAALKATRADLAALKARVVTSS